MWQDLDPLTPANLNTKGSVGLFNVQDPAYGATGDGSTDDLAAINAAIVAASAVSSGAGPLGGQRTGSVVYFPAGEYIISSQISVPDGVTLRGSGRVTSVIKASTTSFPADTAVIQLGTDLVTATFGARLEDIGIDASDITGSMCVHSGTINELSGLRNVTAFSFESSGIFMSSGTAQNYHLQDLYVLFSSDATAKAVGVDIAGGNAAFRGIDGITIDSLDTTTRSKAGIRLNAVSGGMVSRVHGEAAQDVILVGDENDCNGLVLMGIHTGGVSACTNLVRLSNANTLQNIVIAGVQRSTGTNAIADEISGTTVTSNDVGLYVLGNGAAGRTILTTDTNVGQGFAYAQVPDTFTNADGDFAMRWYDGENNVNALGVALANDPRRTAVLATNNNYELAVAFGGTVLMSTDTVGSAISLGANALSLQSATNLPADVSGRGYLYADSGSSLYWVDGTSNTSHLII